MEPHQLPLQKKQKIFDEITKGLAPLTPLQEAHVRGQLEEAFKTLKEVRKALPKAKQQPRKTPGEASARQRVAHAIEFPAGLEDKKPGALSEVLGQAVLWTEPSTQAGMAEVVEKADLQQKEQEEALVEGQVITGKQRLEYT